MGESVSLNASNGATYIWNDENEQTTQNITVSPIETTIYAVTVTQSNGCSAAAQVTIGVSDISVNLSDDIELCESQNILLEADYSPENVFLGWNTGQSTDAIEILATETQTYSITVSDFYDCFATDAITIEVLNPDDESCNGCLANAGSIATNENYICDMQTFSINANSYNANFNQTYLLVSNDSIIYMSETGNFENLNIGNYSIYAANYETNIANPFLLNDNINDFIDNELNEENCYDISEATNLRVLPPIEIEHRILCSDETTSDGEQTYYVEVCISGGLPQATETGNYIINSTYTIPYSPTCNYTTLQNDNGLPLAIPISLAYTMQATDALNICETVSNTISIPQNFITTENTEFCLGEGTTLTASNSATYLWLSLIHI